LTQAGTNIRYKYARAHISNVVFYIPFFYYYVVRLGTFPKLLSWMLIYILPTAFYSAAGYDGTTAHFATNYILILIATFSLYELGYIFNDTVSIRYEEQPSVRLYEHNFRHFSQRKGWIIGIRIFISLCSLFMLFAYNAYTPNIWLVALSIAVMCGLFAVYNTWRSHNNVWLYPLLVFSRYIPFMLIYQHDWLSYLLLFLSFPFLNALERFSMPRYRWKLMRKCIPDEGSKTLFRVIYYFVVLLVLVPAVYFNGLPWTLLIPFFLLGTYRLGVFFLLKYHKPANYLNG